MVRTPLPAQRRRMGPMLVLALLLPGAATAADDAQRHAAPPAAAAPEATATPGGDATPTIQLDEIDVVATSKRLNEARTGIQTQTGASTYTLDAAAIAAVPGGDNVQLNQVLLQTPEVAQDSFGQFHIRGEHNGLQYRLNGIILPEGMSVFGQSFDPRLISSMSVITGALPAEYGLRTAGIVDLATKSGAFEPGGSVSLYGGSHGTLEPSIGYAGTAGTTNYFFSLDGNRNRLGIESPDGSSNPVHDRTSQYHGFAYLEDIVNANNRVALAAGTASGSFQIPDQVGLQPGGGWNDAGRTGYNSAQLNETQREITHFGVVSLQHSSGPLDLQTALVARFSSLNFTPDPAGDLLFNGISEQAYKRNTAFTLQSDGSYQWNGHHTVRAGVYVQADRSTSLTTAQVFPVDASGAQVGTGAQTVVDDGAKTEVIESVYLQDEYLLRQDLTVNYGARLDRFTAYTSAIQLSPRLNLVWRADAQTTLHGGYARYLSPPPFELVGGETLSAFAHTSAAPAVALDDTPQAERANYLDLGLQRRLTHELTLGMDSYLKKSSDLIDEGQFGAPIILTPFNYAHGKQMGLEFTANYAGEALSAYANLAFQSARGEGIESAQFNFSRADLDYIAGHYIDLDHEQRVTGSGGASYLWHDTRFSADMLLASGLRADQALPGGASIPNGRHLPYYTQVNGGIHHVFHLAHDATLSVRFDVINVFDRVYEIRNGTGVGVGAPQFGARRGYFIGLSTSL